MPPRSIIVHQCIASCPLGLEDVAAHEMRSIGLSVDTVHIDQGVIEWHGEFDDIALANVALRCSERITVKVGEFRALHFGELRRKAAQVRWEDWIAAERPVIFRVQSVASKLYHERGIAERLAGALEDRLGREVEVRPKSDLDDPEVGAQLIVVRVRHDQVELRIDSSGARLHRRGYRLATAKAPIRETLAASILLSSGWSPGAPLLDPFCGSGTFAIEAAQWMRQIAPGHSRSFAFESWPQAIERPQLAPEAEPASAAILASDRDAGAIEAASSNAERARVSNAIEFSQRTISQLEAPGDSGWIVTNPPYAIRTDRGGDPVRLYETWGEILRERFAKWHCTMLCGEEAFARATGIEWDTGPWINNGGIRVRLLHRRLAEAD